MKEKQELRPGHYFEFLDRAHIAAKYIEMSLGEHPVLDHEPHLREIYEQIEEKLALLYQSTGRIDKTFEKEKEVEKIKMHIKSSHIPSKKKGAD